MNQQPYHLPPRWWAPKMTPWWVRFTRGYRKRVLRRAQRVQAVEVRGGEHLRGAIDSGAGVLVCPNHSVHYDSAALYLAADQVNAPLYFMTAWQVFGMSRIWERWFMQRIGCFSIDRESNDLKAFKQAVSILRKGVHPLVIFPEGDIFHCTDRVVPFREGAAAVALAAVKKSEQPVVVIPTAIKFVYLSDPTSHLQRVATLLEDRVLLRPLTGTPLFERIHRIAEAVLALKELDYLGHTRAGKLRERVVWLTEAVLAELEQRRGLASQTAGITERVKAVRQAVIKRKDEILEPYRKNGQQAPLPKPVLDELWQLGKQMDDVFFVTQLYSYPGDYLIENPSIERLAETLDKLEEDVLRRDLPSVHGDRKAIVEFGEPLAVVPKKGRGEVEALTVQMQTRVQDLLGKLNASVRTGAGA